MIGFYDYTVILTYVGLLCAIVGIFQSVDGAFLPALFLVGGALICDTLDGKVARSKKGRTKEETLFGIQIDSLCDVISFGVFPGVLCYCAGLQEWYSLIFIGYYCLCCVIRLGYFNVLATLKEPGSKSEYRGLPVVGLSLLLPMAFLLGQWLPENAFLWLLRAMLLGVGTLYIMNFKVNKPTAPVLAVLSTIFLVPLIALCFLA